MQKKWNGNTNGGYRHNDNTEAIASIQGENRFMANKRLNTNPFIILYLLFIHLFLIVISPSTVEGHFGPSHEFKHHTFNSFSLAQDKTMCTVLLRKTSVSDYNHSLLKG